MTRTRSARLAPDALIQPCVKCTLSGPLQSITPNPVRREPGSSPRMRSLATGARRMAAAGGSTLRHERVGYLGIRIHALYAVEFGERLKKAQHVRGGSAGERYQERRAFGYIAARRREAHGRHLCAHGGEFRRI